MCYPVSSKPGKEIDMPPNSDCPNCEGQLSWTGPPSGYYGDRKICFACNTPYPYINCHHCSKQIPIEDKRDHIVVQYICEDCRETVKVDVCE